MFELKQLSIDAVPAAIDRAKRYRLLNEPWHAESICRDVQNVDPDNQQNLIILLLAITDQFGLERRGKKISDAMEIADQLRDSYQSDYAKGIIYERQANAATKRGGPRAGYIAYNHLVIAMEWYEKSARSHPDKNEESKLRYNTCVRMIERFNLRPAPESQSTDLLE